ncbi:GFA family protein [Neisseriaceae bacterium JH1-16]|nr:GFA family protein [Neisseriaceae bacterium JH1-16]
MSQYLEGGCQCGSIRYRLSGAPLLAALCHCSMCRRASAAPAVAWAMYEQGQLEFESAELTVYESSPGALRGFCPRCGTQISFRADYLPGLVDITIGSLDDPAKVEPTFHYWDAERLPWVEFADRLPRHAEFPPLG